MHTISSISNDAESVVSTATNLETKDALKIKMKKIIRKKKNMNTKTKNSMGCATIVNRKCIRVRTVGCQSMAIIKNLRKQKEPLMGMRMT